MRKGTSRQKHNAVQLKDYEWEALASLLQKGIGFAQAYALIKEEDEITPLLEKGMELETILFQHAKGKFYDHLRFFLQISPLPDAIFAALQMKGLEKAIYQKLIKQTSYPILIFAMAFFTLYFFSVWIIPQLMQSFDMETQNVWLMRFVFALKQGAIWFLLLMLGLVIWIFICLKRPSLRWKMGKWLLHLTNFPASFCSYTLAGYFIELQRQGVTSYQAFQFLTKLQKDTWFGGCVSQIKEQLETGNDLLTIYEQHPFIDASFTKSWSIGLYTQKMSEALMDYMKRQEHQWLRQIKRIGIGIQCGAYAFVAFMVLLVYQIMLVPLQILETM